MEPTPWYELSQPEDLDSPALLVYPDRVQQNIDRLVAGIDNVSRLRPHVKTHKTREATRMLMAAWIGKFKCATIAEADMLAGCGAPDVLLAYQPVGPKIHRLIELMRAYPDTQFSCLVDSLPSAQALAQQAVRAGLDVPVYIDLNVGMNRTGTPPDASVVTLYADLAKLAGVQPVGLHAYDGHLRDPDITIRTEQCDAAFQPVQQLSNQLMQLGFLNVIVAGGSPTFPIHARRGLARRGLVGGGSIECSPGTFIYWDKGYGETLPEQPFRPAALVLTRVISLPDATKICVDLGHKSVAAECDLALRVTFLNAPGLRAISQSEEHLVLEAGANHGYQIGDVLYGLPNHICPTCALHERAVTIENGTVTGEWRTIARDRTLTV